MQNETEKDAVVARLRGRLKSTVKRMADGGTLDPQYFRQNYNTPLSPEQEAAYQAWLPGEVTKRGQAPEHAQDDYDMRGFYANRDKFPNSGNGHWPDNYKKPNHDTFSDNSIYHNTPNPEGGLWVGGHWTEKPGGAWDYAPSPEMLRTTHPQARLEQYIRQYEPKTRLVLPAGAEQRTLMPAAQPESVLPQKVTR